MTAAPTASAPAIRATVHPSVLSRITRFFDASLPTAATELLQNARRAGATRVDIRIEPANAPADKPDHHAFRITVRDDGCGVAKPSVLLAFGNSGWDRATIAAEDAAGMGLACLAHTTVEVRSATAPKNGFAVTLEPRHFAGDAEAPVRADRRARPGTAVAFAAVVSPIAVFNSRHRHAGRDSTPAERALEYAVGAFADAAHRYPVPVAIETPDGPRDVAQQPFLHDTYRPVDADPDAGVAFGVHRTTKRVEHDFNVFGLLLNLHLPSVTDLAGATWAVRADVRTSPGIRLVLPARRGAADDDALARLRQRAELALYQGIRTACEALPAANAPRLPATGWYRARNLGVDLPVPPAELPPAAQVRIDGYGERRDPRPKPLPGDAVAIDPDHLFPTLLDALEGDHRAGSPATRLVLRDPKLAGYDWHRALPEVDAVDVTFRTGAVTHRYAVTGPEALPEGSDAPFPGNARPDAVHYIVRFRHPGGQPGQLVVPAILHLHPDIDAYADEFPIVAAARQGPHPAHVGIAATATYFCPSDDCEADSYDTQRNRFTERATELACHFLLPPGEAIAAVLRDRVLQELVWDVPRGAAATIRIHRPLPADDGAPAPAQVRISVDVDDAVTELAT